jgi:copper homeostasis protein CutC
MFDTVTKKAVATKNFVSKHRVSIAVTGFRFSYPSWEEPPMKIDVAETVKALIPIAVIGAIVYAKKLDRDVAIATLAQNAKNLSQ